jgi:hypothetical protein
MKVILSSWYIKTNQVLKGHSIGQWIKVILSSWNIRTIETFGVHSIGQ